MAVQKRRFKVTLERRVEVQGDTGHVELGYSPVATVPAAIETLSGREYFAAKQINAEISTRITIAYRRGIDETFRIRHLVEFASPAEFDFYDVLAVIPDKKTGRTSLELLCTKRHAEGWRSGGDALTGGTAPPVPGITIDWSQLTNIPTEFPPAAHVHDASDVTTGTFADARISESSVTQHQAALSIDWSQLLNVPSFAVAWADITGKPATFPPDAHNHAAGEITSGTFADARIAVSNVTQYEGLLAIDWAQLDNVPATFPPSSHAHAAADITSGTFADGRISAGSVTQHEAALTIDWSQLTSIPSFSVDWADITSKPATFPPSAHAHAASDVTSGTFADARISASSVTQHAAALAIDWTQLTSVPATFPPSAHNHAAGEITSGTFADARIAVSNVTQYEGLLAIDWAQLDNVPATFPPSAHNHAAGEITSGTFADARIAASNVTQHQAALSIAWGQLTSVPATFTPSAHVHDTADVTTGTFANARIAVGNITQHQASIDHGSIAGLADDDHPQYILVAGTRAFTGTQATRTINPSADDTYALGTTALRYSDVIGTRARVIKGTGTVTQTQNAHMFGRLTQSGTGSAQMVSSSINPFSSCFTFGSVRANGGGTAKVGATFPGAVCFGAATSAADTAEVSSAGAGCFVHGQAQDGGFGYGAIVQASDFASGSFVQGQAASQDGSATVRSGSFGSFTQGYCGSAASGPVAALINNDGAGSLVQGAVVGGGTITSIYTGVGALAQGYAENGATITASGYGAMARGYATGSGRAITASGAGAVAQGRAMSADIVASAANCMQFGPGTNAEADTFKVGTAGLRLKGTTGAPGTPVNGDIYLGGTGNAFVTVRSNAKAVQLHLGQAYTIGTYTTKRALPSTGTATLADVVDVLSTLIFDLRTANHVN